MSIATWLPFLLLPLLGLCAIKAVQAAQLLAAALWLAGLSAATAASLYLIGAYDMAVIELSLSLGLVTVLLAFAISMVGANSPDTMLRRRPDRALVVLVLILMVALILPATAVPALTAGVDGDFSAVLWETRQPDILVQIALIFAGVLGVLRLLRQDPDTTPPVAQVQEPTEADKEAVS